ncbi:hypothetical protein KFL_006280040 [Klebsormidium nitens]|uniref:Uncharacterized protein n=1 Tax=Klebsormidium nitens TaxID=105231 RepID=A0A1Y1ILK7_KLENI|nr:hypothetical protein KFL_006280040 [Klebsormidium nitens]|eukprot:GAQ90329.1 hypothetical protein KFL_006280040 [Klebsormidium nitens]
MQEARKERIMTCIAVERMITAEVSEISADPTAMGLRAEEVPSNQREKVAMENLVLQKILKKRRVRGGYVGWRNWRSMKNDFLGRYAPAIFLLSYNYVEPKMFHFGRIDYWDAFVFLWGACAVSGGPTIITVFKQVQVNRILGFT